MRTPSSARTRMKATKGNPGRTEAKGACTRSEQGIAQTAQRKQPRKAITQTTTLGRNVPRRGGLGGSAPQNNDEDRPREAAPAADQGRPEVEGPHAPDRARLSLLPSGPGEVHEMNAAWGPRPV